MDSTRRGFIEPNGANGAQFFTQPEKVHRRRTAAGLAQPSQSFRAAIGRDELIQLAALDQREARRELTEDRGFRAGENLPSQILHGRKCRHDDPLRAHLIEQRHH